MGSENRRSQEPGNEKVSAVQSLSMQSQYTAILGCSLVRAMAGKIYKVLAIRDHEKQ